MWRVASPGERFRYRVKRHPLVMLFAYVSIFAVTIGLLPLRRHAKQHWDAVLSLLALGGLISFLGSPGGFELALASGAIYFLRSTASNGCTLLRRRHGPFTGRRSSHRAVSG
jgi:hypothetical protein